MGFGPFSSESTSSQTNKNVQDQGQLNESKSKVAQGQGILLDNTKGKLNTGVQVSGKKNTVNISNGIDDAGLQSLVGSLTTASSDQINRLTNLAATQQSTLADLFKKSQADVSSLADNQQTGGDSKRNKIVLYVVLAVVGLLGVVAWRRL